MKSSECGSVNELDGWRRRHCAGLDVDRFFPREGERRASWRTREREALAICEGCPIVAACLAVALAQPISRQWGVLGGTTHAERRKLIRAARAAARSSRPADLPEAA
jgi:WhiB family redox-sensing transcriptional regulator